MPELPEVEVTRRGIEPLLIGKSVAEIVVRQPKLRWPVPADLTTTLVGRTIRSVSRRGKYLLLDCEHGWLIIHLGMSGSLRVLTQKQPSDKHDHFDLVLADGTILRLRDPRRFGAILWEPTSIRLHPLIRDLGPEPLDPALDKDHLWAATRRRQQAVKIALMDSRLIVGVGNIYANESLFRAGIRPMTPACKISRERYRVLQKAIYGTLEQAIAAGGSTLRDFVDSQGKSGYFQQHYFVYGRADQPCRHCGSLIKMLRLGQRATYYCPHCQH